MPPARGPAPCPRPLAAAAPLPRPPPADGKQAAGLYIHDHLPQAVGTAVAAFARCMLAGARLAGSQSLAGPLCLR